MSQTEATGKVTSASGSMAARPPSANYYRILTAGAPLHLGDRVATLPGATASFARGALGLRCLADYDARHDVPVLESMFVLNEAMDADLAVTFLGGRLEVTNTHGNGAARLRLRFGEEDWLLTLETPGTKVAVELAGRWTAGTRFKPRGDAPAEVAAKPTSVFSLWLLAGTATVKIRGQTLALNAKPGPNHVAWDSLAGAKQPETLSTLPAWATATEASLQQKLETFRQLRAERPVEAIEQFLKADDIASQRIALVTLGANDDIGRLLRVLGEPRTTEQWNFAVTVLRHWLAREAGQDQKFYERLQKEGGFSEPQARIVLQLLFGIGAENRKEPETYEVLIDYLLHEKPAIRALAAWHLSRLVPAGGAPAFPVNRPQADWQRLYQQWKRLIPTGELPPP